MSWIKTQIEWLKSFFSEPIGTTGIIDKASSKRLVSITIAFTFIFITLRVAEKTSTIPEIPDSWWILIASIVGITGIIDYFNRKK